MHRNALTWFIDTKQTDFHFITRTSRPYLVKTCQNLLLLNQNTYDGLETWYLMSIIVCSNDDHRLTLTYFTAVNFGLYTFVWGRWKNHIISDRKWKRPYKTEECGNILKSILTTTSIFHLQFQP